MLFTYEKKEKCIHEILLFYNKTCTTSSNNTSTTFSPIPIRSLYLCISLFMKLLWSVHQSSSFPKSEKEESVKSHKHT